MNLAYLDTSVWITRTEGIPAYRDLVRTSLQSLMENEWQFCLSDLVRLETLIKPQRENQLELMDIYNKAFQESIHLFTFDGVFQNALSYSQKDGLKTLDAIHVAFAVYYNCKLFVTTDPDFQSLNSLPVHWIDLSQTTPQKS